MSDNYKKRISRLNAIVTQLQARRLLTASELARKYAVSTRPIYRDLKALEHAGVSIVMEHVMSTNYSLGHASADGPAPWEQTRL